MNSIPADKQAANILAKLYDKRGDELERLRATNAELVAALEAISEADTKYIRRTPLCNVTLFNGKEINEKAAVYGKFATIARAAIAKATA